MDVRLLGPLEVIDGDGAPVDVPGLRPKGLLAYLALQDSHSATADRILDEVWADDPPASMATTLQVTISRLRKAIGRERIETTPDGYRLAVPSPNTDLERFRLHARRGRQLATLGNPGRAAEAFRQSLAEWRGPPLSDLRQLEFAERAAHRIEEERLAVVEELMAATLAAGDHQLVVGELSGMVDAFPFRERLWELLMLALYRAGRQADALAAYQRATSALGESLGVEPSAALRELEERILLHDPALDLADHGRGESEVADAEQFTFPAGAVIVDEGEVADTVYWIESGRVEISRRDPQGGSQVLAELGSGRYFGELAALMHTRRTARVRALVPTSVTIHDVASFRTRLGFEHARTAPGGSVADIWGMIGSGQYLAAYDSAMSLIERGNASAELRYLAVLALVRSGATTSARRQYETLGLGSIDLQLLDQQLAENIAVLPARLDKAQALRSHGELRTAWAKRSAAGYEKAFDASGAHFHAVNAATMWLLAGDEERATGIASSVTVCRSDDLDEQYWTAASEAEAALVLGDRQAAAEAIERAAVAGRHRSASRATTLKQLKLVCDLVGIDRDVLEPLRNQRVVHYCGHVIQPDGRPGRFPVTEQARVARDIRTAFDDLDVGVGFGSLAAGADILAAEALLERGAELNVVLPFAAEEFLETSVLPAGEEWRGRFTRCLEAAASVEVVTTSEHLDDPVLFDFCSRVAMGDALIRAGHLETDAHQVAVWDGTPSGGVAGTAIDVARWASTGRGSTVIPVTPGPPTGDGRGPRKPRQIRAILFADFAGFSKLTDAQVLDFQDRVMAELSHVLDPFRPQILSGRTWGDGVYLVFDDVASAAECALTAQEAVSDLDFNDLGLPALRGMRVAAHATPVFDGWDPISGNRVFYGAGVTQAARIEPRTPEGQIYTTHPFAALAVLAGSSSFECQYVGMMPTAKGYGSLPLYTLRRTTV